MQNAPLRARVLVEGNRSCTVQCTSLLLHLPIQAEGEEGGGGIRTVTFSNGNAIDLEDLNLDNIDAKWELIHWVGGTMIMPG